jgi:hypothetical protein
MPLHGFALPNIRAVNPYQLPNSLTSGSISRTSRPVASIDLLQSPTNSSRRGPTSTFVTGAVHSPAHHGRLRCGRCRQFFAHFCLSEGRTPLLCACIIMNGTYYTRPYYAFRDVTFRCLVSHGADVNICDRCVLPFALKRQKELTQDILRSTKIAALICFVAVGDGAAGREILRCITLWKQKLSLRTRLV